MDISIVILIIILLIDGYFLFAWLMLTLGSWQTTKELLQEDKRSKKKQLDKQDFFITLLLPVLREQNVIEEALQYYKEIIPKNGYINICIITTQREEKEQVEKIALALKLYSSEDKVKAFNILKNICTSHHQLHKIIFAESINPQLVTQKIAALRLKTTYEICLALVKKYNVQFGINLFTILNAPEEYAGKVGQMNYALKTAIKHYTAHDYVGVYDIDSRPHKNTISALINCIKKRKQKQLKPATIYQQVASYTKNLATFSGLNGLLSIADALGQTRWAIGFEYCLLKAYSLAVAKALNRPLTYCIGHGCFVQLDFLLAHQGFPTQSPNDDLALGYLASYLGEEIAPIPCLDVCDGAPNALKSILQSRFWYYGSARFSQDIAFYTKVYGNNNITFIQRITFLLQGGHLRNIAWAWRGYFALIASILTIIISNNWSIILPITLISIDCYIILGHLQTIYLLSKIQASYGSNKSILSLTGILLSTLLAPFFVIPFLLWN
jgi:cellulose synthase/poly-beta-1,6-N-acetylglucosamine synthase-like glycosyltransferase